ncbi:MAG: hypothetical protein AB1746_17015 [Candidatus Zixiibacteriota bacterium]
MLNGPDHRWQSLITDYLDKLDYWQKIMKRQSAEPGFRHNPRKLDQVLTAYKSMKSAERALKDYEIRLHY